MILTRTAILGRMASGHVVIHPPPLPEHCGPNSVDLHLGPRLARYRHRVDEDGLPWPLDPSDLPPLAEVPLDTRGRWFLRPGQLYLGETLEHTETRDLVPVVDGRSSLGRVGVGIHVTAGRGDVGFCGRWTLEIWAVQPVWIWPGMRALQITYHEVQGPPEDYAGQFQGAAGVMAPRGRW